MLRLQEVNAACLGMRFIPDAHRPPCESLQAVPELQQHLVAHGGR